MPGSSSTPLTPLAARTATVRRVPTGRGLSGDKERPWSAI